MSASDYFRDVGDVRWRLDRTHLYIGNQLWFVDEVRGPSSGDPDIAVLVLFCHALGKGATVKLKNIPDKALYDAPRGYLRYNNHIYWMGRGPVRDRHQGLRSYSLWYRDIDTLQLGQGSFDISSDYIQSICSLRNRLFSKNWGSVSRDILLHNGKAYYRGLCVGETLSRKEVAIPPQYRNQLLLESFRKVQVDVV